MDVKIFLDLVYDVLKAQHPRGKSFSDLGKTIKRHHCATPITWGNLPSMDRRFRCNGSMMYLTETPSAFVLPEPTGDVVSASEAATSFYAFLASKQIRRGMFYDEVKGEYKLWRQASGIRCGLTPVVQILMATGRLRRVRGSLLQFAFYDPTRINLEQAVRNKGGLEVSEVVFSGQSVRMGEDMVGTVSITNTGPDARQLTEQSFLTYPQLYVLTIANGTTIRSGETVEGSVLYSSSRLGTYADTLLLKFGSFVIARLVKLTTFRDPAVAELLQPTAAYVRPQRRRRTRRSPDDIGARPPSSAKKFDHELPEFDIPDDERELNRSGAIEEEYVQYNAVLADPAQPLEAKVVNYLALYDRMLHSEELAMQQDIESFDMLDVPMYREADLLVLEVPGLAEKRPSVVIGDEVDVNLANRDKPIHRGIVWRVRQQDVLIRFHNRLLDAFCDGMRFDIAFRFRRTHLNIMHHTYVKMFSHADQAKALNIIFPTDPDALIPAAVPADVNCVNRQLNEQQRLAVKRIVERGRVLVSTSKQLPPFVIFGPPGTGKTSTMVESIFQVVRQHTAAKLLVMAPSNAAADVMLTKLSTVLSPRDMFRLMSFQRNHEDVSAKVLEYCLEDANKHFVFPNVSDLRSFKVIVCTCAMASKLYYYGMDDGYFSYVFIDESGHCWEPEALASFYNLVGMRTTTRLVLAGDPQQLGPIVRSPLAAKYGFQKSLLERYTVDVPMYAFHADGAHAQHNGYDPRYIVQLVHCYRCHPDIMRVPNELFYHNHLISSADPVMTHSMLNWPDLPNQRFPMLFHGCVGEHQRQLSSPSWFNITEAEIAVQYVQSILAHGRNRGIAQKDIGIISPYALQVKKIRQALEHKRLSNCTVGSCEQFQGQERRIIIISTVRSSVEHVQSDQEHDIGFLSNPKRFNVAITRAQALVIIIGNPHVLNVDANWRRLLEFCRSNNGYTGVDFGQDAEEDEVGNIADLLNDLTW